MKLQSLIVQANTVYSLSLDQDGINSVLSQMRMKGHAMVTEKPIGPTVDAILAVADKVKAPERKTRRSHTEIYASLKAEAQSPVDSDSCPRCKAGIRTVKLVGGRSASYCQACNITLPMKVE